MSQVFKILITSTFAVVFWLGTIGCATTSREPASVGESAQSGAAGAHVNQDLRCQGHFVMASDQHEVPVAVVFHSDGNETLVKIDSVESASAKAANSQTPDTAAAIHTSWSVNDYRGQPEYSSTVWHALGGGSENSNSNSHLHSNTNTPVRAPAAIDGNANQSRPSSEPRGQITFNFKTKSALFTYDDAEVFQSSTIELECENGT